MPETGALMFSLSSLLNSPALFHGDVAKIIPPTIDYYCEKISKNNDIVFLLFLCVFSNDLSADHSR
jgi:hypothetical protein